jgi:DNA-binding IclR family transcriptional regulator
MNLTRFTPQTITSVPQLKDEIERVRKIGYAVDMEEEMNGQICIGAAVRNRKNDIAGAIWLVAPSSRMDKQKIEKTGLMIKQSAERISTSLGYLSLAVA